MAKKLIKKASDKKELKSSKSEVKGKKEPAKKTTTVPKKTVTAKQVKKANGSTKSPIKKATKTTSAPKTKPVSPVIETLVTPPVVTPPPADFSADLAKSTSVAATTIEKKEFVRTRRTPVVDEPKSEEHVAELNRIVEKVIQKVSRNVGFMQSYEIKQYILKVNPDASVRVEHPRADVKSQSKFHITVGNETATAPVTGWFSTNG